MRGRIWIGLGMACFVRVMVPARTSRGLKRYEELRLAARKRIMNAASAGLPKASLSGNIMGLQSRIGPMYPTYMLNFGLTWNLDGMGLKPAAEVQAARWRARKAMLDPYQELLNVMEQVRNSYNQTLITEVVAEQSTNAVLSAEEELRLARMRLNNGLGTNIDVLTAQRDLTQARLDKALALINFNKEQAQLLHDI
jgi:outer membrane factor, OMF family